MSFFSEQYVIGYNLAFSELGLPLSKEADFKSFMKKMMLTGAVAAGGAKGAIVGGETLSRVMSQHAAEEMRVLMAQKKAGGAFVDAAKFVEKNMSNSRFERAAPEDLARATIKSMDAAGSLPKNFREDKIIRDWMQEAPYSDMKKGTSGFFNPSVGAITGERTHPSIIAHELAGHGGQVGNKNMRQWFNEIEETNSPMGVFKGNQIKYEQDAWDKARQAGYKIDPEVEESSMNTYRKARAGMVGGGVAGAGVGAGATGLGLMGISSLLANLRRKRR